MIKKNIEEMINEQINFEIYSGYVYMAMASYCDYIDLKGFANWFKIQAREENLHAEKMYNYLVERGGRVVYEKIPAPKKEWENIMAVFENGYKHEQEVTDRINKIMTLAMSENDHATTSFFKWFVDEQVEEEANFDSIIKQLKMIDGSGHGLFMMDKEMGSRVFVDSEGQV